MLAAAAVALTSGCGPEPDLLVKSRLGDVTLVAVLPFEDAPGPYGQHSGQATSGFVTSELTRGRRFRLVERSKLTAVMNEQQLQVAEVVDTDTAVKIGRMLGVHAVIVGSVSQYDMDKTTVYIHVVPIVSKEYKIGATIRMIDVTNGEVIYAHSACGSSGSDFTEAGRLAARQLIAPLVGT